MLVPCFGATEGSSIFQKSFSDYMQKTNRTTQVGQMLSVKKYLTK